MDAGLMGKVLNLGFTHATPFEALHLATDHLDQPACSRNLSGFCRGPRGEATGQREGGGVGMADGAGGDGVGDPQ